MVEQLAIEAVEEIAPQKKVPKIEKRTVKERRQQVLTVLTHMLHSERGMERMTTARLAQAVGVSEAALYRYFPSKTKMFEALLDNIEANLFSRIDQASTIEISTTNRIRDILQMRKRRENRSFSVDERTIATYLVTLCEGQFMRYVRTNFRHTPNQGFEQQWRLIEALFA